MIPRTTIPIVQVKPDLKESLRMAVAEIEQFLAMFYPIADVRQMKAAAAIAGQWLSRVKGFHDNDDFLHLTRDFLSYVRSGGARSLVSDQLAYYFSGFMPSYGASCIFAQMVDEGATWAEVSAFMHSQAYGNAREYVESFDWSAGQTRAQAEISTWTAILQEQDARLRTSNYGAVLLAQAVPQPNVPITDVPINDPVFPKPPPQLRVVPGGVAAEEAAVEGGLSRVLARIPLCFL